MKKIVFALILFALYTLTVVGIPEITQFDRNIIIYLQSVLAFVPLTAFVLPDCILYLIMTAIPTCLGGLWFILKKKYVPACIMIPLPVVTYGANFILKRIIRRPRPDFDLQPIVHPHSFSYVSSHSLVTFCVWAMTVYYFYKYCKNKYVNLAVMLFSVCWIIFAGLSRIMLGVHNPTDVVGAYFLGSIFVAGFIKLSEKYS